jgi:hypothetical protein
MTEESSWPSSIPVGGRYPHDDLDIGINGVRVTDQSKGVNLGLVASDILKLCSELLSSKD